MKKKIDYRPKYSLSIFYLEKIMSKKELNLLIDRYVKAKIDNWRDTIRKNP